MDKAPNLGHLRMPGSPCSHITRSCRQYAKSHKGCPWAALTPSEFPFNALVLPLDPSVIHNHWKLRLAPTRTLTVFDLCRALEQGIP